MRLNAIGRCFLSAVIVLSGLIGSVSLVHAEHQKVVGGIIVNVGVVPVGHALNLPGEAKAHGNGKSSGEQHLLVSLSDVKQGTHIADAQVTVEIKDPKGNLEKKMLILANTAGAPDYSEIFRFGYSGKYVIRVFVTLRGSTKQIKTSLTWTHVV